MTCEEFDRRLDAGGFGEDLDRHTAGCEACRRRRTVVDALRALPRIAPPDDLDRRVLAAARTVRSRSPLPLFARIAAAIVLVVGGVAAATILFDSGGSYRPLGLRVVDVTSNGATDEEIVFEEIYGPETPILEGRGEQADDRSGR